MLKYTKSPEKAYTTFLIYVKKWVVFGIQIPYD